MKVYLVVHRVDYAESGVLSVWDSEQKAQAELKRLEGNAIGYYDIDCVELNAAYQKPKNGYKPWD